MFLDYARAATAQCSLLARPGKHVALTDETPAQEDREAEHQAAAAKPEAARSIKHEPIPTFQ